MNANDYLQYYDSMIYKILQKYSFLYVYRYVHMDYFYVYELLFVMTIYVHVSINLASRKVTVLTYVNTYALTEYLAFYRTVLFLCLLKCFDTSKTFHKLYHFILFEHLSINRSILVV